MLGISDIENPTRGPAEIPAMCFKGQLTEVRKYCHTCPPKSHFPVSTAVVVAAAGSISTCSLSACKSQGVFLTHVPSFLPLPFTLPSFFFFSEAGDLLYCPAGFKHVNTIGFLMFLFAESLSYTFFIHKRLSLNILVVTNNSLIGYMTHSTIGK